MTTRKLVFWTAWNSYQSTRCLQGKPTGTTHPVQTMEWTTKRAELWRKFTLNSLLNQSHSDFLYIVLLDPALRHLTDRALPRDPDRQGGRVIYCYEDEQAIRILRQYDEIVMALIDNDDMYSRDAGELMMGSRAEWMYLKHGYAYHVESRRLWAYDTIGSGPFFAHRMDPRTIVQFDRAKRHPTHKAVIGLGPEKLADGRFCVLLHNANTSSNTGMRYVIKSKPQSRRILKDEFGR